MKICVQRSRIETLKKLIKRDRKLFEVCTILRFEVPTAHHKSKNSIRTPLRLLEPCSSLYRSRHFLIGESEEGKFAFAEDFIAQNSKTPGKRKGKTNKINRNEKQNTFLPHICRERERLPR